ncbi:MAG: ATP-dependent RecD-like DNA helicase [Chitinispirillales bacterium]|jgi:exodeoxyribonuclease V alpha subunit|nr:ATP-dependent RecD-like DNA helicase [Chitinispirillales bacterium]
MKKIEELKGTVGTLTYHNADNGYSILQLDADIGVITCVGIAPNMRKGLEVTLFGKWTRHKRFGHQFAFEAYEIVRPTTINGIMRFLESGLIRNIGSVRAKSIVDTFGLDTLNILDNDPGKLSEVPGIGVKTLNKIIESWHEQRYIRDLVLFLQEYDITLGMANRIYKAYGAEAKKRVCENPYALIDDVRGIGFVKADAIAVKFGFDAQSYKRIKAGLTYALQEAASADGHTYLPKKNLESIASKLLKVDAEQIVYTLDYCTGEKIFINEDDRIYLPYLHRAEKEVAQCLSAKIKRYDVDKNDNYQNSDATDKEVDDFIAYYQEKIGWIGAPEQLEAVRCAAKNNFFILTGGPGTGKTTVLQVIVAYFRHLDKKIELAAPTGRAAARMGSISGVDARTIHRLLEFRPSSGSRGFHFAKCADNPIDADVIILDETSMVDILLMKNFLAAIKHDTILILVGDFNQLPSVGPGNVLSDLIACPLIPHVQLTKIFRQSAQSRIVAAAHEIIRGIVPKFNNAAADNCFFMIDENPYTCLETIVDLVKRRLPVRYGLDPMTDIQVLSPMHKGILGTINMNYVLQAALNGDSKKISIGQQYKFKLGDRVIQTKNNYESGVFNGDIGFITAISDDAIAVTYDKSPVFYEVRDFDQITPAYCISIHKSQGSEFKAVVIPVSTQHFIMLQRNLIYTALTRARELCVFVGSQLALSATVRNNKALTRNSHLRELIRED